MARGGHSGLGMLKAPPSAHFLFFKLRRNLRASHPNTQKTEPCLYCEPDLRSF